MTALIYRKRRMIAHMRIFESKNLMFAYFENDRRAPLVVVSSIKSCGVMFGLQNDPNTPGSHVLRGFEGPSMRPPATFFFLSDVDRTPCPTVTDRAL